MFRISNDTVASLDAWIIASGLADLALDETGTLPIFVAIMNDGAIRMGLKIAPTPMDGKTVSPPNQGASDLIF